MQELTVKQDEQLSDIKQFCFVFCGTLFSIPLHCVIEVGEIGNTTPVPWKEKGFLGMTDYRGLPVPVINPALISDIETDKKNPNEQKESGSLVILEEDGFKIAIVLTKFYKIIPKSINAQENEEDDKYQKFILAITIVEDKPVILLDTQKIADHYKKFLKKQFSLQKQQLKSTQIIDSKESFIKLLFFALGEVHLCFPVAEVEEVLENIAVSPLFKVAPMLRGLINVRGKVIACIDISHFLGQTPRSFNENTRFILLQEGGVEVAICVDSVSKMNEFEKIHFLPPEGLLTGEIGELASGVFQLGEATYILLSTKNIVQAKELQEYLDT
ncbi:MAG: chemotaxis protein CheW [Leptospiraceae bacterium]|nr:chemotaxis protein CheW [Leptospiraceae bacterium]MCP5495550.1 chemotaxis protein CheW [Leptospiraceae bacterium]